MATGFVDGMLRGQALFENFRGMWDKAQERREIEEVTSAKPQESTGYTANDGKQLEELAGKGYKIDFDQGKNAYVASNEEGDVQTLPMKGVTDFLGERTEGQLSAADQDKARFAAVADVIGKRDPVRGMQLRQQQQQNNHATTRMQREEKQWQKEDDDLAFDKQVEERVAQDLTQRLTQEDGSQRQLTADDMLYSLNSKIGQYVKAGRTKQAAELFKEHNAAAHAKIQMESEERKNALTKIMPAVSGGDYAPAVEFMNRYAPSATKVTGIQQGKGGNIVMQRTALDGSELPEVSMPAQQFNAMLLASSDPSKLYQYSQDAAAQALRLKQDERAARADARAERADARAESRAATSEERARTEFNWRVQEREAQAQARKGLAAGGVLPDGTPMTDAQKAAVESGVMTYPGFSGAGARSSQNESYDPAKIARALGTVTSNQYTGQEIVTRNAEAEEELKEFWANNPQLKTTDQALVAFNRYKQEQKKSDVQQKLVQAGEAGKKVERIRSLMTPENLKATAAKSGESVEEVRARMEAHIKELEAQAGKK